MRGVVKNVRYNQATKSLGTSDLAIKDDFYGVFSVSKFERSYTILMRSVRNFMRSVS